MNPEPLWNTFATMSLEYGIGLLFCLLAFGSNAQVFRGQHANFQSDRLDFNESYIRENRISFVRVSYQNKAPGRPLKDLPDYDEYYFDAQGRLLQLKSVRTVDIRDIGTSSDTTVIVNRYDGKLLVSQSTRDKLGEYLQEWQYDSAGRCISVRIYRNDVVITSETAEWKGNRCRWYNGEGRPYRDEWEEADSLGFVAKRYVLLLVGDRLSEFRYSYDTRARVTEIAENRPDGVVIRFVFTYSEPGELLQVQTWRNDAVRNEIEVLYNKGLPEAFIIREPDTNFMRIGKFEVKRNL